MISTKIVIRLIASLALALSFAANAQMSPIGTWHIIDDETGKPTGEIQISDKGNGVLVGVLLKNLQPPSVVVEPICSKCEDDRKDKPKLGMELVRGVVQTAGSQVWEGGTIMDPNKGKIYKLRLMPIEGGAKLQVRGYIGPFFRTQTWLRVN
jgi:uncharacterized protein (DUF2147 family)